MAAIQVIGKVFTSKPAQVVYATTGAVLVDKVVSPAVDYIKLSPEQRKTLKTLKKQAKMKEKAIKAAKKAAELGVAAGLINPEEKKVEEIDQETMLENYDLT